VTAADPGDTILVCAGNYNESLSIDKSLTLKGAQAGTDARGRGVPAADESVITGAPSPAPDGGVRLDANDITLDGFVVEATDDPGLGAGVAMSSANNDQRVVNNIIRNNSIGLYGNNAPGAQSVIRGNAFSNNNAPGGAAGSAIYADGGTHDLLIDDNSFARQENAAILLTHTTGTNSGVQITDNDFVGGDPDPALNEVRVLLVYTEDTLISGNTFTGAANNAVQLLGDSSGIKVTDNEITDSGFAAVRIRNCSVTDCGVEVGANTGVSVIGNVLEGNDSAINVGDGGYAGELVAHGNRIVGNTTGIVFDDAGESADATGNWWGCNDGPGSAGCDTVIGAGADSVDADPPLRLVLVSKARVRAGEQLNVAAKLVGTACLYPDGSKVTFGTSKGKLTATTVAIRDCAARTRLKTARSAKGYVRLTATLDNQLVTRKVSIIPG